MHVLFIRFILLMCFPYIDFIFWLLNVLHLIKVWISLKFNQNWIVDFILYIYHIKLGFHVNYARSILSFQNWYEISPSLLHVYAYFYTLYFLEIKDVTFLFCILFSILLDRCWVNFNNIEISQLIIESKHKIQVLPPFIRIKG